MNHWMGGCRAQYFPDDNQENVSVGVEEYVKELERGHVRAIFV